ncbi:hypothetical protein P7K49_024394 [Saguinus oedipus]|uniref:Uncharacterized protein n=1 Tax=Saguinus oedipus TaxID=9490 RepID=A0ABQ9UPE7_SAGOE|nr:hypothetical protein P7K49_024394 [Saguinus oedipus]
MGEVWESLLVDGEGLVWGADITGKIWDEHKGSAREPVNQKEKQDFLNQKEMKIIKEEEIMIGSLNYFPQPKGRLRLLKLIFASSPLAVTAEAEAPDGSVVLGSGSLTLSAT